MKDSKKVTKTGRQVRDRRKRDRDRDRDDDEDDGDQDDRDQTPVADQGNTDQGDLITTQADIEALRQRDDKLPPVEEKVSVSTLEGFVDADPSVATTTLYYPVRYTYDINAERTRDERDTRKLKVIILLKDNKQFIYDGNGRLIGGASNLYMRDKWRRIIVTPFFSAFRVHYREKDPSKCEKTIKSIIDGELLCKYEDNN